MTRFSEENVTIAETIAERFGARRTGRTRWIARCPAHDDRSPSLAITAGRDGKVLVRCWAGCDLKTVLHHAGLQLSQLFPTARALSAEEQAAAAAQQASRQARAQQQNLLRAPQREAVEYLRLQRQALANDLPSLGRQLAMLPVGAPGEARLTAHLHSVLSEIRWIDFVFEGEAP